MNTATHSFRFSPTEPSLLEILEQHNSNPTPETIRLMQVAVNRYSLAERDLDAPAYYSSADYDIISIFKGHLAAV